MKVFISSTYVDLAEHRKAAHDALEKLGLHVIWMEAFGARPEESTKACLNEVEESDLFVGIYAHRYGYIPTGSEISITEQEFEHAYKLDKPIFGFIINEDHAWSPKLIEYDKKDKLNAFLSNVKKRPIDFFTTPDNLAQKIVSSIGRTIADRKAEEKNIRQEEINVSVNGNFNGNLTVGDHNTSNNITLQNQKPTGNTLPNQEFFVGRDKERDIIFSALSQESRTWGALIDGPGGIGKTALAIHVAHKAKGFGRKIFITAKVRELTPEGEKPLKDFSRDNYVQMLDELGKELGLESLEKLTPEERPNELRLALAGKKALIVFDNLETLPEEERTRLFQFLSRLPTGNKAIVTSRRRTDVDVRIVRLDRLSRDEALQLIAELADKYPRLDRASPKERVDLYEITKGNPLFIRWIAGQLGRAGSQCHTIAEACAFIDKAPKGNDPLEYIFGDLLETFTIDETKVLAALTYFSVPAKLKWIADMTGLPARAAETALEDLTDRSILTANLETRTFYLPPLTAQFIKTRRPEAVTKIGDSLANYAFELALEFGGRKNIQSQSNLAMDWPVISAALPYFMKHDNNDLQIICEVLDLFLRSNGLWDEWLWLNQQAEIVAIINNDYDSAGERAYKVGLIYSYIGKSNEVLQYATRAEQHWQKIETKKIPIKAKSRVNHLRGISYKLTGDYPKALEIINSILDVWHKVEAEGIDIAAIVNTLGEIQVNEGGITNSKETILKAEKNFSEAVRIALKHNRKEEASIYMGNLADIALRQGEWSKLELLAKQALVLAEEFGQQDEIARENLYLAIAYLNLDQGNPDGLRASKKAVEIYRRLAHKNLPEAEAILNEWEK